MNRVEIRASFYTEMEEAHGLNKDQVIRVLRMAKVDTTTFDVEKVEVYKKLIEENVQMFKEQAKSRVHTTLLAQIARNQAAEELRKCPVPGCEGEISTYFKNKWRCSVGGFEHYRLCDPRHQKEAVNNAEEIPTEGSEGPEAMDSESAR